eukprot:Colp12_sorted_trinity150504_noHs@12520
MESTKLNCDRGTLEEADKSWFYGPKEDLNKTLPDFKLVPKELYGHFVDLMPIVCIDVVARRPDGKILLILRDNEPLKGVFFLPGGRMLRGETFFQAAERKLKEETGVVAKAIQVLDVRNTFFTHSEWQTRIGTQTVNLIVLLELNAEQSVQLDGLHSAHKWVDEAEAEKEDTYVLKAIQQTRMYYATKDSN